MSRQTVITFHCGRISSSQAKQRTECCSAKALYIKHFCRVSSLFSHSFLELIKRREATQWAECAITSRVQERCGKQARAPERMKARHASWKKKSSSSSSSSSSRRRRKKKQKKIIRDRVEDDKLSWQLPFIYIYVCMYLCVYVRMYACMYARCVSFPTLIPTNPALKTYSVFNKLD
jgi:hypothetical protein